MAQDAPAEAGAAEAEDSPQPKNPFHASPYLPLDRWEYPILDYWVASGLITTLSPTVKPWRRMDIARAIAALDESRLGGGERDWLERLRASFAPELTVLAGYGDDPVTLALELSAGAELASQTHRDPLRPDCLPLLRGKRRPQRPQGQGPSATSPRSSDNTLWYGAP